jgi:glycosyltransferase involved in cell wall biosynthesis
MRVLVVTKLFPNAVDPLASIYNREQYGALGKICEVEVLGLIPSFPGARLFARWWKVGRLAAAPRIETIAGLTVHHPRMLFVPRVPSLGPPLVMAALWREIAARRGRTDVIVGSCAYPEGVACIWLGRMLGIPTALQTLGSDLNVTPNLWGPRQWLSRTLPRAGRVVAVSRPLADRAIELGASPERTLVVPNGVDKSRFFPRDPVACRRELGLAVDGRWIVYVGELYESKGVVDLLAAFERLAPEVPDAKLAVVGPGPELGRVQAFANKFPGRVVAAGGRPHDQVALFMGAADVCTLPSWREGTPNAVIEALASGRRVVATRVGGIPDVIRRPEQGELVEPRDIPALASALTRGLSTPGDARALASDLPSWSDSARLLHDTLAALVREQPGRHPPSVVSGGPA